jgi:hypothetical protein
MHKVIHFIGIGGTAMATLAALLKKKGFEVRGSDQNIYPPMSTFLEEEGIVTMAGYSADHITPDLDLVVVGNAISRGNPELEALLERKIRYCSLPEAVREHFLWGSRSIVIAAIAVVVVLPCVPAMATPVRLRMKTPSMRAYLMIGMPRTSAAANSGFSGLTAALATTSCVLEGMLAPLCPTVTTAPAARSWSMTAPGAMSDPVMV